MQNYAATGSRFCQQNAMSERSFWPRPRSSQDRLNSNIEQSALRAPPMDDLPPPNTKRWVARRKAAVVAAVRSGRITMDEALRRYQLTNSRRRSSFPGSMRSTRMVSPVCVSHAFSCTAGRIQPAPHHGTESQPGPPLPCRHVEIYGAGTHKTAFVVKPVENLAFPHKTLGLNRNSPGH